MTANGWSKYVRYTLAAPVAKDGPVLEASVQVMQLRESVLGIVESVKALLKAGNVVVPGKGELEISHHYGLENFPRFGLTMITVVNRAYCKKLLVMLPGQTHPEQHHKQKEETFVVLHGEMTLKLDGVPSVVRPGDVVTVERGVRHEFHTAAGVVFEEISSTHIRDDSFYTDPAVGANTEPQDPPHLLAVSTVRVSDWLMRVVARAGVRHVFLVPGGGAMHLNDALAQCGELSWVHCFHEQACGIAAEAHGRIAGRLGVAMVTAGPGATNILTPVAGAWIESSPLMIISGQVKRADLLRGAPLRQRGVQEVDAVGIARPVVKYAVTVEDPMSIRYHFERALHLATTGRPGPVWLDIPLDVQAAPVDPERMEGYQPSEEQRNLDRAAVIRVADMIRGAQRPLMLAGHGVRIAGAAPLVQRIAERFAIPVATTWNALDLLPYGHPLSAGRPGVVALRTPNLAVQNCDLLIAVGARLDNVVTAYAPRNFARNAKRVVIDIDPNELAKLDMETEIPSSPMRAIFFPHCSKLRTVQRRSANPGWSALRDGRRSTAR